MSPRNHQTTRLSDTPYAQVTITHPFHPLRGQQVEVLSVHDRAGEADLWVSLPDGTTALMAMNATDYATSEATMAMNRTGPRVDWVGLQALGRLLEPLRRKAQAAENEPASSPAGPGRLS
jgi:hypothetical protein